MKNLIVVFLTMLAILFYTIEQGQDFDCDGAKLSLIPCVEFLTDGGNPSTACCDAIKDLKSSAPTRDDRHAACECLKAAVRDFPGAVDEDLALSLPKRCGVDMSFTINKDIKCNESAQKASSDHMTECLCEC